MVSPRHNSPSVDVVIPIFNERPESLTATLSACIKQTYPISRIFVVDDGSSRAASLPSWALSSNQIVLLRLPANQGISAARNAAITHSTASLLACINAEVLPDEDWLATCESYLFSHHDVGACYTRIVPERPDRTLTRWRMRFHEINFGDESGPSSFAPGHAVLFRRCAIDAVGGYDIRYRRNHEDSDICHRMRKSGWETHYVASSRCVSTQEDSLKGLAAKQLTRDTDSLSSEQKSLIRSCLYLSKWTFIRAARNIAKGRLRFVVVDMAILVYALRRLFALRSSTD
jgi:N-acetylglucosaminyltransferase